ncbi:hypothetical protein M422DRAFT_27118 [Sphaerobolus stellatus SS14]|nr:hypothetical protein M422DRAFT_27118 [Sphaerobolus stellatus SS14]
MSTEQPQNAADTSTAENLVKIQEETNQEAGPSEPVVVDFKVWNPPEDSSAALRRELPDSYFEPSTNELKALYQSQVKARQALQNAPLKTQQIRSREVKAKLDRYPTTRIRIKFPDRTQLEKTFPSTDKIRSVYAFVRNSLRDDVKPIKFVLYQAPPRRELKVSDPDVKNLSLFDLQLTPSSVLMLSFFDESLNDPQLRAPLLDSILALGQDLPPPPSFDDNALQQKNDGKSGKTSGTQPKESLNGKPVPKWFKMGLKK